MIGKTRGALWFPDREQWKEDAAWLSGYCFKLDNLKVSTFIGDTCGFHFHFHRADSTSLPRGVFSSPSVGRNRGEPGGSPQDGRTRHLRQLTEKRIKDMEKNIFEKHYEEYCRRISELDLISLKEILGIEVRDREAVIPFLGEDYFISGKGMADVSGHRPGYMICVILSKYLLLCPSAPIVNKEWVSLKDFHKTSQFTNLNVFASDAEGPIVKIFSGRPDALAEASRKSGGKPGNIGLSYDLAMEFKVLPKIDIMLLFNDQDEEFPAACSMLFQRQAEHYLDPESLIMTGAALTQRLKMLSDKA